MTVAFSESNVSRTQVQLSYNQFKEGREDVNNDARPGRPSTAATNENIEAVKKMNLDRNRLLMMLVYLPAHAKKILRMFQIWNVRHRRLFQNCKILSKTNVAWTSLKRY